MRARQLRKYDITKHPNYHLTEDADSRNAFDMEKYLSRKLKLNSNEEYTLIEGTLFGCSSTVCLILLKRSFQYKTYLDDNCFYP